MIKKFFKKSLIATATLTLALFSFSNISANAASYNLAEEKLTSHISISGDTVEGNLVVFDDSLDKYNIGVSSSLDITPLWKYNDYYYEFDPTREKEGSLTTVLRGNFEIDMELDPKFILNDSKDLKSAVENNVRTDVDGNKKGKDSVFFDYFNVDSVKAEGKTIKVLMSYKEGVTGQYLLDRKNVRPNSISIVLNDYVSLDKSTINVGDKLDISSYYRGIIILDTPDKFATKLQNKINELRKGAKSVVVNFYFPNDANSAVTELTIPVSSYAKDQIEFVSKNSAKRLLVAVKNVLPNTGLTNYSYTLLASVLLISAVLIYRRKSIKK